MSSNLNPNLTLAAIEREVDELEPFVLALRGSKRVTIRSPFEFRLSERGEIMRMYRDAQAGNADDLELLGRLMSEDDYEAYLAEDLPVRIHARVMAAAMAHFEKGVVGELGESGASKA